jgi:hypothetical protein
LLTGSEPKVVLEQCCSHVLFIGRSGIRQWLPFFSGHGRNSRCPDAKTHPAGIRTTRAAIARKHGGKEVDAKYESGRTREWLKIKILAGKEEIRKRIENW